MKLIYIFLFFIFIKFIKFIKNIKNKSILIKNLFNTN